MKLLQIVGNISLVHRGTMKLRGSPTIKEIAEFMLCANAYCGRQANISMITMTPLAANHFEIMGPTGTANLP